MVRGGYRGVSKYVPWSGGGYRGVSKYVPWYGGVIGGFLNTYHGPGGL